MRSSKRLVVSLIAAICLGLIQFSGPPPSPVKPSLLGPEIALAGSSSTCWRFKRTERRFARKMNRARGSIGASYLRLDPELSKAARKHTREMIGASTLHHTPTSTLMRRVTNWTILGENVGVGGTVKSLHTAFMQSTAHRENILYPAFRYVGIGVKRADGRMWVTVIFESRNDPGTTLRMPRC